MLQSPCMCPPGIHFLRRYIISLFILQFWSRAAKPTEYAHTHIHATVGQWRYVHVLKDERSKTKNCEMPPDKVVGDKIIIQKF